MKRLLLPLLVLLLSGCAALSADVQGAVTRANKAVTAGLLKADDPLPVCLAYIAGGVKAGQSVLGPPFSGVVDFGVDLYIIDESLQNDNPKMDALCAPVALKILKRGLRRLPGL